MSKGRGPERSISEEGLDIRARPSMKEVWTSREVQTSKVWGGLDHREGLTLPYPVGSELNKDLVNLPEGKFYQTQISPTEPNFEFSSKPNSFNLFYKFKKV